MFVVFMVSSHMQKWVNGYVRYNGRRNDDVIHRKIALIVFTPMANSTSDGMILSLHQFFCYYQQTPFSHFTIQFLYTSFLLVVEFEFFFLDLQMCQRIRSGEACSSLDGSSYEKSHNADRNYRVPRTPERNRSAASQIEVTNPIPDHHSASEST